MTPMDWSYYADLLWHFSVPLEVVPDVAAWLVCLGLAVSLVRFVVFRRPRLCALSALAWLGWLSWQAIFVSGIQALHSAKRRGLAAIEATDHFAQHLLALVKAWTDFFLPFMMDVFRWCLKLYKKMTMRQRLLVLFVAISGFTIYEAYRMFRRHKLLIMHVLFHLSFLVGGPLLWYSSGLLPPHVLVLVVTHLITTIPAFFSLLVISNADDAGKGSAPSRSRQSRYEQSVIPTTNVKMHRLWLSYWACWPALAVFEAGVGAVPKLVQAGNSDSLQIELQRALLTFVVWLQFWQGSRMLHYTVQSMLFNTSFLEYIARFFGARGLWLLSILRGGLWAGVSPTNGFRVFGMLKAISSRLWLACVGLAILVGVVFLLVTLFYRALSVVSSVATMLLWLCAASDSADTLTNHAEDFYTKKLSFWVLAMIWEACTKLPYVGVILRLFTPFAFSLWILAGEAVLRRLILPSFRIVAVPLLAIGNLLVGLFRAGGANNGAELREGAELQDGDDDDGADAIDQPDTPSVGDTGGEPRSGSPQADSAGASNEASELTRRRVAANSDVSATGGLEDDVLPMDGADTGGTGVPEADEAAAPPKGKKEKGSRKNR